MESIISTLRAASCLRSLAALTTVVIAAAVATPAQAQPDGPWPTAPSPGWCRSRLAARPMSLAAPSGRSWPMSSSSRWWWINKPGAAGAVGAAFVAKSKPDG